MLAELQWLVATFGQSIFSGFAQLEARWGADWKVSKSACLENVFDSQTKHRSVPLDWLQGSLTPKDFEWICDRFQGEIAWGHRIRFEPAAPTMEVEKVHPVSPMKSVRDINQG